MSYLVNFDKNLKVWSGPNFDTIYNQNVSAGFVMLNRLMQDPNKIIQIVHETGSELTSKEIYDRSIKIANFLSTRGFKQGDVIGFIAKNSENVASILIACLTLGLPFNPFPITMSEHDLSALCAVTKPKAFFCDANELEGIKNVTRKLKVKSEFFLIDKKVEGYEFVEDILGIDYDVREFRFPNLLNISSETALIMFTSGTTDSPKGICNTHKQVITTHYPFWLINNSDTDENVILTYSSISWITQLIFVNISLLYGIKRIIMSSPMSTKNFCEVVDRHNVAVAFISPSTAYVILKEKLSKTLDSLKHIIVGGSIFGQNLVDKLKSVAPNARVIGGYGNTETGYIACGISGYKDGSTGVPLPHIKLKVIDKSGNSLNPSELGEICIKSSVPFAGFYNDPIKSSEAVDSDNWLYSGDIGFIDQKGFVFIFERKRFMLKNDGYYITPLEIETIINEIDGVVESCVVGVYDENEGNDIIFAYVIKNEEKELSERQIEQYANNKLSRSKRIRGGVHFMKKFPLSSNGKIIRKILVEISRNKLNERVERR